MPAENNLIGESVYVVPDDRRQSARSFPLGVRADDAPGRNVIADGTEWTVGLIVLGSLGFLALLELGGFKTVLAASISTGR